MCSIIGYYGDSKAAPIMISGLRRMEYRGYDSVGIATKVDDSMYIRKGVGRVDEVNKAEKLDELDGMIGLGHTRWATHGKVTRANAHPHASNTSSVAIVHNGIIENFTELKTELEAEGFSFESETDTEVIANLLQKNYDSTPEDAMIRTLGMIRGHYSFVAMFADGTLAAARYHEPLIVGINADSYHIASDVLGFVDNTDDAVYVENGHFLTIDKKGMHMYDFTGKPAEIKVTKISKEIADVAKGEFTHYTLKEITEQPKTVLLASLENVEKAAKTITNAGSVYITGSGTSYNASLVAQYMMSRYARVNAIPIVSSEFSYSPVNIDSDSVLIAISQSGESADVIAAVNDAKKLGAYIISILNAPESTLARESDMAINIKCGREIGVAATKSFTSQLVIIYSIVNSMCDGKLGFDANTVSSAISDMLKDGEKLAELATKFKDVADIYVLGRGIHYPMAMEAALKLKELSYIHAEGIAGGELKHGPLALIDNNVYAIVINPSDSTYKDTLTSAREIKARGAHIIGVSDISSKVYDTWVKIPKSSDHVYPITEIVPIQLLAYYSALVRGADPDYPRNLAKSVTVR
ncbi:MAG: glutamine-fructose-6-phosphate transaminase [Cenarchaeum symbiont of Oopsacas minuta]|nr:glutamine-fructose-6-phosphate transaminase [Cenarchaeum symbiont of Oopsacas minuta]